MPGISFETVSFARKDEQTVRNPSRIEGTFEQVVLSNKDVNVFSARDDVGGCSHLADLPDRSLSVVVGFCLPRRSSERVSKRKRDFIVAPTNNKLDVACACNRGFEPGCLCNKPVRQEATEAIASDRQPRGIGDVVVDQRIDPLQYIAPRAGACVRDKAQGKSVSIAHRAAVVGLEYEPPLCCSQRGPCVPVKHKAVAVRRCGSAVDQCEHWQMLGTKFPRWVDQHPFDVHVVIGFPTVGFAVWQLTLCEQAIESSYGMGVPKLVRAIRQVNFIRPL